MFIGLSRDIVILGTAFYHIVLHVDVESAESWSDEVIIERLKKLFKAIC